MTLQNLKDEELLEYYELYEFARKNSNRAEKVKIEGADFKFLYHVVRLLDEVRQILTTHDLDLQQNREQLKAIRRGEWTEQQIRDYFTAEEKNLEKIYAESTLPWGPDEDKIKALLLSCLELHYGNLDKCIYVGNNYEIALRKIEEIIEDVKRKNNGAI